MAKHYTGPGTAPATQTTNTVSMESHPTGDAAAYPKYKYHKKNEPVVVNNSDEEDALGEGFADAPFQETE